MITNHRAQELNTSPGIGAKAKKLQTSCVFFYN